MFERRPSAVTACTCARTSPARCAAPTSCSRRSWRPPARTRRSTFARSNASARVTSRRWPRSTASTSARWTRADVPRCWPTCAPAARCCPASSSRGAPWPTPTPTRASSRGPCTEREAVTPREHPSPVHDIDEPGLNTLGGVRAPRRLRVAAQGPGDGPRGGARRARSLPAARPRRRGLRDGQEDLVPAQGRDGQVPRLQRRRVRAGHLQGPRNDAEDPAHADRGDHHRRHAAGVDRSFIYIRGEYVLQADASTPRWRSARAGYIGEDVLGSGHSLSLDVHRGAGAYICGEETGLLDSLEGKRGNPRLKPPFPANQGLYQGPTLINNVETLATVPAIMRMGGEEYAKLGMETLDRHQARVRLRARAAARQLRDRARHPLARDHLRPRRRPARGARGQVLVPRRLLLAGAEGRGPRPPLRLRLDGQGRLDARLRRDHRRRRHDADHRRRAQGGPLLPPRVLRQVHPLPRGHQLDGQDARAHRHRRGHADGYRDHGLRAGAHHGQLPVRAR